MDKSKMVQKEVAREDKLFDDVEEDIDQDEIFEGLASSEDL